MPTTVPIFSHAPPMTIMSVKYCMNRGTVRLSILISIDSTRACLKNHSRHLYAPLCVIFAPHSVDVARYASFIWHKSPTNCDVHLTESIFQTRSSNAMVSQILSLRYCCSNLRFLFIRTSFILPETCFFLYNKVALSDALPSYMPHKAGYGHIPYNNFSGLCQRSVPRQILVL